MNLTRNNYHSLEANREYMSFSQYKDFLKCEAAAMARICGDWQEESSDAMLLGSYVHAWAEGALDKFKEEHPEIFTKQGELKAPFRLGDEMIQTLADDELIMKALEGEKEVIMEAEFGGCRWKIRFDVYNPTKQRFTDLKTAKSLTERVWDDRRGGRVHFIESYGYVGQMAIYQRIEAIATCKDYLQDPYMVVVTKENPPDKAIFTFPQELLDDELRTIELNLPRILAVKSGKEQPERCEQCAYCRSTKKLTQVWDYHKFIGA
jgi:hypothetical protein